ncbi:MAG: DUF4065 domain-containing protein [Erythrobacter sp.]|uniref:Panacea domain-containing protein n=1 Tax=Erythrobacter sp. TaxID=1042 RepID=UPI0025FEC8D3|nr:type II toxin-antitoxin system antitoxin SocA domain-containing protein [Erythrobacter sp.]MCL9998211.1 DUF4065 domain-containing protein [Erythrobacter sp.]
MEDKEQVRRDLLALAAMADDEIDTSDIPERALSGRSFTARFYPFEQKGRDIRAIANWFIDRGGFRSLDAKKVWINKLPFIAYEKAIQEFRIVLTPARVEAWNFGPVFRELYFDFDTAVSTGFFTKFSLEGRKRVKAVEEFTGLELSIFEDVWKTYGGLTSTELTRITHKPGSSWDLVWNLGGKDKPGMAIEPALIAGGSSSTSNGISRDKD